ncbi:MAG: DUF2075 domain-containing protein [Galactobacillus timonensis]|uniref:DNA/RNA helicase domain-containing protein n=1 Tax=Galactobacillus timonensis TaxID=2041840 RepID=UPI002409EA53|nr:DNA/RNA helicase domain-containing protein [Galactobacillus timonensis]MDD6599211.1 DUF2075 domain-containing protein [Galactobacillus timonensis]
MNIYFDKVSKLAGMSGKDIADHIYKCNPDSKGSEKASWQNSLPSLISAVNNAGLSNLNMAFEFPLLSNERIDAVLTGYGKDREPLALLIELKQWSSKGIRIYNNGGFTLFRIESSNPYLSDHPLNQVLDYEKELLQHHENFESNMIHIASCVFMFNFETEKKEDLFQNDFKYLDRSKVFTKDEMDRFSVYLSNLFFPIEDNRAIKLLINGEQKITPLDMECIQKISEDPDNIPLINEQYKLNSLIAQSIQKLIDGSLDKRVMFCVNGAAGTGKTILGFHILSEYWNMLKKKHPGKRPNCLYAMPRSRTILQVLDGITENAEETKGIKPVFVNNIYRTDYDLIVIDEAHRMTGSSKDLLSLRAAKIIVVLQDDNQRVLGNEVGTVDFFKEQAKMNDQIFQECRLIYEKRSGFGSYVERIDHLLYGKEVKSQKELGLDVHMADSLAELEKMVKAVHSKDPSIKYYAPFCWEYTSRNNPDINDFVIRDGSYTFEKQWNPFQNQYDWYLDSIDNVGCIYTAQGLGFDYVALIWWDDLAWDEDRKKWICDLNKVTKYDSMLRNSLQPGKNFDWVLLNIYRVLLTRAKKGVYIWFKNSATKRHFKEIVLEENCHGQI